MASNTIDLLLAHVVSHIPPQILQFAFPVGSSGVGLPVPMHEQILARVMRARVLKDCNLLGGKGKYINLLPEYLEETHNQQGHNPLAGYHLSYSLHRIPPAQRDNMPIGEISEVLPMSIGRGSAVAGTAGYGMTSTMAGQQVLNSITQQQYRSPPIAEAVAGDLIRLSPSQYAGLGWTLVVTLHYDADLTGLNSAAVLPFCTMMVHATKAYIYNQFILQLDQGFIQHGADYPGLRSVVDSYAGANDDYAVARSRFMGFARYDVHRQLRLHQFSI